MDVDQTRSVTMRTTEGPARPQERGDGARVVGWIAVVLAALVVVFDVVSRVVGEDDLSGWAQWSSFAAVIATLFVVGFGLAGSGSGTDAVRRFVPPVAAIAVLVVAVVLRSYYTDVSDGTPIRVIALSVLALLILVGDRVLAMRQGISRSERG